MLFSSPFFVPYCWLVDDIDKAVESIEVMGATIAMSSIEIPGKGKFSIYILGDNENGLWQLRMCKVCCTAGMYLVVVYSRVGG